MNIKRSLPFFSAPLLCMFVLNSASIASAGEVDMTTLDQLYYTTTTSVGGVSPYFTESVSSNSLTINSLSNLASGYYNTQNLTPFQLSGNFTASVTVVPRVGLQNGAGGGLQAQFGAGNFAGGNIFGAGISANYGFGPAGVNTPPISNVLPGIVFDLERTGDVFNVFASTNQGLVKLESLTGANVSAPATLDLVENVNGPMTSPQTLTFENLYVLNSNTDSIVGLTGGTSSDPIPLPASTVKSISGDIGGASPSSDYYSFYWKGGEFAASVGVVDAQDLTPSPTYTFELCGGATCTNMLEETVADSADGWQSSLSGNLAPGLYTVGIINNSVSSDPTFSFTFNTPISQVNSAPEPSTWAMMLLGFAGLGFAGYRASQRTAVAAQDRR